MSKKLNAAFLLFVLIYMVLMQSAPAFLWLLKVLPIFVLIIAVLRAPSKSIRLFLFVALFFSGCGDILLALDHFTYGLSAFLLAQITYAVLLSRFWHSAKQRWPLCLFIIIYSIAVLCVLLPHLGALTIPVIAYLCAISMMGILAIQSSLPFRWVVLGAMVFIVSDSLIAFNKFVSPLPLEGFLIMSTYYIAQYLLVTGFLRHSDGKMN